MIQSIDRAVDILNLIGNHRNGLSVSDLSQQTGLALSTTHRILQSLVENRMVVQDDLTKHYKLGVRVLNLAMSILNNNMIIDAAKPHMTRLATRSERLVYLCLEQHGETVCVDFAYGPTRTSMQFFVQIGSTMPLHASAPAKTIFSYRPETELRTVLDRNLPLHQFTPKTICSPEDVLSELGQCREQGYAVCDEEMQYGISAVAAPVFRHDGKAIAAVATIAIKEDDRIIRQMADDVIYCAQSISQDMGYMPLSV